MKNKQLVLIGLVIISNLIFAEITVPKEVRSEISRYAVDSGEENKGDFIRWQSDAYIAIEKKMSNSQLTEEEKNIVRRRLKAKFGVNYARQSKELKEEMEIVSLLNKESRIIKEEEKKNTESKEELKVIVEEAQSVVPKKYMEHFKSEAERLYPNSVYEQKRYIESSINTYKKFN